MHFGIETITTFIQSRSSLENHTRLQTKMGTVYKCFQTKNHTYLYGLYKGVPPISVNLKECENKTTKVVSVGCIRPIIT